jgi:hypothetical protein
MSYSQKSSTTNDTSDLLPSGLPSIVLAPLCDGLCDLNARVAEEFLALAAVLQSNSVRARQITAESHKATGSDANLHTSHSIAVLQRILTDSAAIGEMVKISTAKMLDILSHVKTARAPLQRLTKMRSLLQTVGVLSRIEGARIMNTSVNLSGLSKDIDTLAGEIQQHLNAICDDSFRLSGLLQNGVGELSSFEQQERLQTADLIQRTQAVLVPMIARLEASQIAAHDIDEQYASFRSSTDKVVMSLQSEDIARQRVEHVWEAIRRVGASLDAGESVESCAGVLALQRSQLAGTRDLLTASLETIHSGLQSLSPRIHELVSRTSTLAQQAGENGRSFATVVDDGLGMLSTVFNQCSASAKAVLSIVDSVLPSVEQMTKGACALDEIEASIHLISLNATVKTAHLGSEGIAIGVIASELHSITKKSEGDTKIVLDGLAAISDALAKITSEEAISESSLMMTSDSNFVSSELAGLSESVRTGSEETTAGLNQVLQLAEALCSELERGCELAVRAASITQLFDEQLRNFDDVFGRLGYTEEMAVTAADGNRADDLSKLYSMDSERKLHLEVFGGNENFAESTLPTATSNESSEFGDDVELF